MSVGSNDTSQWLSVTEETLFLHDGLMRVTDLVEIPPAVSAALGKLQDAALITFDTKSPSDLADRIKALCGQQNNEYTRLLEYRVSALKGLWRAQQQCVVDDQNSRGATSNNEEAVALLKKQGLLPQGDGSQFSSRLSLLLLFPLLQSQSNLDSALCGTTAELLLACLRECAPLSLMKEPADCLSGLENLLCSWLGENGQQCRARNDAERECLVSAVVALASGRGTVKTILHTVHLLQNMECPLQAVPVGDILRKLLALEGGPGVACAVLGSKHILTWGVEDLLGRDTSAVPGGEIRRSITCDDRFLFVTNGAGKGLAKIGMGLQGTLRGLVYSRNTEIGPGYIAWASGTLLYRPCRFDQYNQMETDDFAQIVSPITMEPIGIVKKVDWSMDIMPFVNTVQFCSDGIYFYWLWIAAVVSDRNASPAAVHLDVFKLEASTGVLQQVKPTVTLQKKDEISGKTTNESLLARFRPYRSYAAVAASLTGLGSTVSAASATSREDSSTSCGIAMKTLMKAPIFTDGSLVVVLTPVPGTANQSATRSLFGSGSGLAGLRSLAINMMYSVSEGQFISRTELADAPTCSLARGTTTSSLGVCFDMHNNQIWCCSGDWVDQFFNPSHQAAHHICKQLGLPVGQYRRPDDTCNDRLAIPDVVRMLLHHVGSMGCHQVNSDMMSSLLGGALLQQQGGGSGERAHLAHVRDVLRRAVTDGGGRGGGEPGAAACVLTVLHVVVRTCGLRHDRDADDQLLIDEISALLWQILDSNRDSEELSAEVMAACRVINAGLTTFYETEQKRHKLLHHLLTTGSSSRCLMHLRGMILSEYAEQLRNPMITNDEAKKHVLPDDLVQLLLKIVMKESSSLLRECTTPDHVEFDRILASVPMTSVCLQYMMALQSHLLRNIVLYTAAESGGVAVQPKPSSPSLQNMQAHIIQYAKKVFSGTEEVLETLHEVCNALINSGAADLEWRLQGLERIAKATALGHLLPVLISSLTHYNACCLGMADKLMPQLVQLIILTSQAALLLKSQVQAMRDTEAFVSSTDMLQIMEGSLSLQNYEVGEKEECGFLAGLKIPAPWATGKSVESSHPLRDNYKFKETVHIPGARCLFLRFDIRCSSQYDYDKLILYAGPGLNSRKVAEYGGNTLGFGSRSVLGSGWPKDLVKVEGDTVTFSFEMRSGREHNTPDKAMWGFLVTVRAQEMAEDASAGLPFLADLALGLSVLGCTMLHILYQGPAKSHDEDACQQLLKSRLLQRCLWQREHGNLIAPMELVGSSLSATIREESELSANAAVLPRIKLPSEVMQRLRQLSGFAAPQFRPSIREVIEPEKIEESIVSAVVKHLGLADTVRHLVAIQQHDSEEYCLLCVVLIDTYRKMDSLLRQLQTIAELEQRWQNEVNDIRQGMMPASMSFFAGYHLTENKSKELALLCYLKEVEWDPITQENCVTNLRGLLEIEASSPSREPPVTMQKTRKLVVSVLERTELLLHVTIATDARQQESMAQSLTQIPDATSRISPERPPPTYGRSVSFNGTQSLDDSTIDIHTLRRKRQRKGPVAVLQDLAGSEEGEKDQPAHALLLDQLFSFVGSNPERAVACQSFLSAAQVRWRRGHTRKQALVHMKELLTAACRVGGATHLVAAVTSVLQHGPRIEELTCGGMVEEVREAFAETMASVVQLCARYPLACCNSIGLLCIIPYTRNEEKCLVRSGLVGLLDKLCNMSAGKTEAPSASVQSPHHLVALMAWAGFQVLSSRCVTWEKDEGLFEEELEHSGLAWQVSALLSNHLTRATENSGNEAAGNEALQEVLNLLNNLSRSNMGKAILSQPACVSKLLSLLLDQRPSPNLILIILQLCRVALPLMMATDCAKVELPSWSRNVTAYASDVDLSDPPAKIASLLLAKLGDFVVPGSRLTTSQHSADALMQEAAGRQKMEKEADAHDGRLSVFLHKREDQSSHEVLQPLLSGSDSPFRLTSGANMEKIVRMDRDMTKHGKTEIFTEDAVSALRRAAKMAQAGMIVSTGPLVEAAATTGGGGGGGGGGGPEGGDRKKMAVEAVCKDKNSELARMDPVRPFISGHVANSMATEVIALLHSLLTAPETSAAQIWTSAVKRVLSNALSCVPLLVQQCEHMSSKACNVPMLLAMARQAAGALCALGGFHETIKPGSKVQVIGDGIHLSTGSVLRVAEAQGMATVLLDIPPDYSYPRASDTIELPIARLVPPYNEMLPLGKLSITRKVIDALLALLVGRDGRSPLLTPLPMHGDGTSMVLATARVIAEIRTRACMVLAAYLKDVFFASAFIQHSVMAVDVIKALSTECNIGERLPSLEKHCERLRMLYRDCVKPPPPPSTADDRGVKPFTWDTARIFPPVRACLFSHSLTGVTFLGEPGTASGLPRGTLVYANQPIPPQATSFYFEIEICSFGELQDDSGPIISFGFAPPAERKDGSWTNPVGTVMFHNNGRAVHYNGSSLLQWKSVRLDVALTAGDVAGIFWQQEGEEPDLLGNQQVRGSVFFTYNGQKLAATLDGVAGGLWPIIHMQKKNVRIKTNFGQRAFVYAEASRLQCADSDFSHEISETFGLLPFHDGATEEPEGAAAMEGAGGSRGKPVGELRSPPRDSPCRITSTPNPLKEYNSDQCLVYRLEKSYSNLLTTGPDPHPALCLADDTEESEVQEEPEEDYYALLVKAWEQKIFPVIRRRFRNEAERKDGLEQIKGALQLGMVDIARQTVEFLYEENGGMPRDLHLPNIDDIKEEAAKVTVDRVHKGMAVVIQNPGSTVLPPFAVRGMLRMFGLTGVVLDVDTQHELVQVEAYLRSDGVLVRYWFPLHMLERPQQGHRRTTVTGSQVLDVSNINIHRELLGCEADLARMYCRSALLQLIEQCSTPQPPQVCDIVGFAATMAASTSLLQELHVENLQLLSNELLITAQPAGPLTCCSLVASPSLRQTLARHSCSASDVFYVDQRRLKRELEAVIERVAGQGEQCLIELTNNICVCLQIAPEDFPSEEMPVTEGKLATDVSILGASFLIVSCLRDPKTATSNEPCKAPWARVYCYSAAQVNKHGQICRQEVVCYPRDAATSCCHGNQYPAVLLPCNFVHVRAGASPSPGASLVVHGVPPQFPLVLAYIESLCATLHKQTPASGAISAMVLSHVSELLSGFLWRTDVPAMLKELLYHVLAEVLRTLHVVERAVSQGKSGISSPQLSLMSPSLSLLIQLQAELRTLYEEETRNWPCVAGGASIGGDDRCFTSYFHALMEVSLAIAEVTSPITPLSVVTSMSGSSPAPTSPLIEKRKKLKAKRPVPRQRTSATTPRKFETSEAHIDKPPQAADAGGGGGGVGGRAEDMLWFHRALTMSQMLRHLAYDDAQGEGMTADAVTDAAQMIATVTAPCRLLIVTGIPIALEQEFVKQAIRKASSAAGGLFRDEVWVLSTDDPGLPRRDAINEAARRAGSPGGAHKRGIKGCAVLEVRSKCKVESCKRALLGSREFLAGISDDMLDVAEMEVLTVATVTANLLTEPPAGVVLEEYLYYKLMLGEGSLSDPAMTALTEIFHSCFLCEHTLTFSDPKQDSGYICLTKDQIMSQSPGNLMYAFCAAVRSPKKTLQEQVSYLLSTYGITKHESQVSKDGRTVVKRPGKPMKEKSGFGQKYVVEVKDRKMKVKDVTLEKQKENLMAVAAARRDTGKESERRLLTLDGLAQFVCDKAKLDCKVIWRALLSCGYDIHFDRFSCIDVASGQESMKQWTAVMDASLVSYVNDLCQELAIAPSHLHPHEVYFSSPQLSGAQYACFQDIPIEGARLRFAMLQTLGSVLESFLLPLVDLRAAEAFPQSTAALLRRCSSLIFYDNKVAFMNRVLNATAQRKSDQAAPEITLDPLEVIGAEVSEVTGTQFAQAMRQLGSVPSSQLCVRLASGGDPVYAFNVRYTGEEVHGTSGSFRHFLSQVTRELHSPLLSLLLPCPSGAVGRNKGMYVLRPGAMSCAEERLLVFFGQLLGITVRADIPLALDMLPVFWKAILCCHIDVNAELPEVDLLTDKYCKKLLSLATEQDFSEMCEQEGGQVRFVYRTLSGDEVQLCPNGHNTLLSWHNRQQFVEAVLGLRATELTSRERVTAIRAGMASIIPLQLLTIMSPADMELRTCGKFFVNLSFLKTHTMYQVGLTESDKHIEYFWNALERFSQDELCKFVKFACNQERIPMMCPCRDGSQETAHVPPYPMKIAPPDGRAGSADSRHVRVETCMFMVKLPQYSCQEVMTERLLAAIHSRDDPLSG